MKIKNKRMVRQEPQFWFGSVGVSSTPVFYSHFLHIFFLLNHNNSNVKKRKLKREQKEKEKEKQSGHLISFATSSPSPRVPI